MADVMLPNSQGPGVLDTTIVADGGVEQVATADIELLVAETVIVAFAELEVLSDMLVETVAVMGVELYQDSLVDEEI